MRCDAVFHPCTGERPGAAASVVLLPGWGLDGRIYAALLPFLTARCHVTVIDLPGFGGNAGVEAGGSLEAMAAAVADAAPPQARWLGFSLGGMVAACVAANEPQRVQALVTAGTSLSFVQRVGWSPAMAVDTFAAFERDVARDAPAAWMRFLGLQVQGGAALREDLRALQQLALPAAAPAALLDGLAVLREADLRQTVAHVDCPSLWLYGAADALVPAAVAPEITRRQPRARAVVLPGVPHIPFLSAAGAVQAQLAAFPEFCS